MLDSRLIDYLRKHFSELFQYNISISIQNGWFPLLLITCRYIHCYCKDQNKQSELDPEKYKAVKFPKYTYIGKNESGLLYIKIDDGDERLQDFLEFIKFISGYICCDSSSFYKNVCIKRNVNEKLIINEKFLKKEDSLLFYIDNEELLSIIDDIFLKEENEQLEFNF
jgi:hypothetical protein